MSSTALMAVGLLLLLSGATVPVFGPVLASNIWSALKVVSELAAPLIGGMLTLLVWFHKRIAALETRQKDMGTSVFGNERDALNEGVIAEVKETNKQLGNIQEDMTELKERTRKIRAEQIRQTDEEIPDEHKFDT